MTPDPASLPGSDAEAVSCAQVQGVWRAAAHACQNLRPEDPERRGSGGERPAAHGRLGSFHPH